MVDYFLRECQPTNVLNSHTSVLVPILASPFPVHFSLPPSPLPPYGLHGGQVLRGAVQRRLVIAHAGGEQLAEGIAKAHHVEVAVCRQRPHEQLGFFWGGGGGGEVSMIIRAKGGEKGNSKRTNDQ